MTPKSDVDFMKTWKRVIALIFIIILTMSSAMLSLYLKNNRTIDAYINYASLESVVLTKFFLENECKVCDTTIVNEAKYKLVKIKHPRYKYALYSYVDVTLTKGENYVYPKHYVGVVEFYINGWEPHYTGKINVLSENYHDVYGKENMLRMDLDGNGEKEIEELDTWKGIEPHKVDIEYIIDQIYLSKWPLLVKKL